MRRKSPDRISRDAELIISVLELCCKRRVVMLQTRTIQQQIETSESSGDIASKRLYPIVRGVRVTRGNERRILLGDSECKNQMAGVRSEQRAGALTRTKRIDVQMMQRVFMYQQECLVSSDKSVLCQATGVSITVSR